MKDGSGQSVEPVVTQSIVEVTSHQNELVHVTYEEPVKLMTEEFTGRYGESVSVKCDYAKSLKRQQERRKKYSKLALAKRQVREQALLIKQESLWNNWSEPVSNEDFDEAAWSLSWHRHNIGVRISSDARAVEFDIYHIDPFVFFGTYYTSDALLKELTHFMKCVNFQTEKINKK